MLLSPARKFLVQVLTALSVFATAILATDVDWVPSVAALITALAGAIAVWVLANSPDNPSAKFIASVVTALAVFIVALITVEGPDQWKQALALLMVSVIGSLVLWLTPNEPAAVA